MAHSEQTHVPPTPTSGGNMQIGTLVIHINDDYEGIGIVIDDEQREYTEGEKYTMVTVHWLDGLGVGLYWTDELEAICS